MDCALMEKISADLIEFMLVTDDPKKLAECHRVYHYLQMKISEKEQKKIGLQSLDSCCLIFCKKNNAVDAC